MSNRNNRSVRLNADSAVEAKTADVAGATPIEYRCAKRKARTPAGKAATITPTCIHNSGTSNT